MVEFKLSVYSKETCTLWAGFQWSYKKVHDKFRPYDLKAGHIYGTCEANQLGVLKISASLNFRNLKLESIVFWSLCYLNALCCTVFWRLAVRFVGLGSGVHVGNYWCYDGFSHLLHFPGNYVDDYCFSWPWKTKAASTGLDAWSFDGFASYI